MNTQDKARKHYRRKYKVIVPELMHVINLLPNNEKMRIKEIVNAVEWTFFCEWDCDLDEWYNEFVNYNQLTTV
jgi:hypothetical protein